MYYRVSVSSIMITSSGFSKSNKYYVNGKRSKSDVNSQQTRRNGSQFVKYSREYSTDILDNLVVRHYTNIDRFKFRDHSRLKNDQHRYTDYSFRNSLNTSSSLPSVRSFYIAEVSLEILNLRTTEKSDTKFVYTNHLLIQLIIINYIIDNLPD